MKDEREIIERLEAEGVRQRKTDLSVNAVNATRRRVAHILAEKRETEAEHDMMPWFKVASAAIAVVLISVLLIVVNKKQEPLPSSSELAMQKEIAELSSSLRGGLSHFLGKHRSAQEISLFDVRRASLKARIDRCFIELQKELTKSKVETVGNKCLKKNHREHIKKGIKNEEITQNDRNKHGSVIDACSVAGSCNIGAKI
ncbi:MAG: hypothetical protein KAH23_08000 [Kiritimatiellae bacterium]|nr:hypothetical protein [Kiritimatiellia bacterium]